MRITSVSRFLRLSLGVLVVAMSTHAVAEIILYEHDNYNGRSLRFSSQENNLVDMNFNDKASSAEVRNGSWQLCNDSEFRGHCITLSPGRYPSLGDMDMNDRVSSLRPIESEHNRGSWGDNNASVELYEHANYRGQSVKANGSSNLKSQGFNDKVSSIIIHRGRWEFCVDADFRGQCMTMGPGRYENLRESGHNDDISSFRALRGSFDDDDRRPRRNGWRDNDEATPEIIMGSNREGEVIFRNDCVVYYSAQGRRYRQQPKCDNYQVYQADQAMAAYRREQGM
jgi:hypothetical protein